MPSNMTKLEQSIIANARAELSAVLYFYRKKAEGSMTIDDFDDAWRDYLGHYHALNALLMFAHQADVGMSAEAVQALQLIEEEHAGAYRASAN
ncbi:hypothetical protein [Pseudomonas aeruginosa]|uniref:hypothetical protein n=1 Tax=Pseudomonas aeruginosa TaxID=287 RepID=UPI0005B78086|nr:hypothetical protein [Pseudomonas aeruginosa]HCA1453028.1 hypothetical protein [Klebsiella pneumoniae]MBV6139997.1 hypothetical protein [Pseudomonas aeruginosa]MCS7918540.1 hypothetical protein [Pseudomonas aeruginosa]OZO16613.1 hypothetical protein CGU42_16375 [Pseudomonas aeruginosa]RPW15091.1 hypothetical protein IPC752_27650 [Pseudomonas aeruginosa]